MPYPAVSIANEFLKLSKGSGGLTQMALQKLTYFSHGWNWAVNQEPLVDERPQAWSFGPVYRELYDHTKFFGKKPISRLITPSDDEVARFFRPERNSDAPYSANLSDRERQVVRHVWSRYGALDAIKLSELTHQPGTPWFVSFKNGGKNAAISDDLIRSHYDGLAERAQAA